ncbi:hypothetical protein ACQW5G_05070 [Fructilactobacillus sp. Tb1]|uniref:P8 family protein n=1 Tax=Fructilactobacillus sp. Tb1 TaxID=3422304 RepID=UPI003D2E2C12
MADKFEENTMLDEHMNEAFDWSDSAMPVRDALWDHYMQQNAKDTIKTEEDMKKYLDMSDADVKAEAEKLLKK